eukprot:Tbor_TRINITY_DN3109_c0_g1::TRINITY_DN3109_c0_g1_i1::g.14716::m.14716
MMRKVPLPCGKKLYFDQAAHAYAISGGVGPCKSVSAVLDRLFPFDSDYISKLVADKQGTTPESVIKGWSTRAALGSNVHAFIEQKILNEALPFRTDLNGEEHLYYPAANEAAEHVLKLYEPIAVELMIASPRYKLAGTIDFLGRNRKTGAIFVGDWKTAGTLGNEWRLASFQTPALPPVAHMINEKMSRYSLQILTYGYLLRIEGYDKFLNGMIGPKLLSMPMEYGIIQMGKQLDGLVGIEYKEVKPSSLIPRCAPEDKQPDEIIEDILFDFSESQGVDVII